MNFKHLVSKISKAVSNDKADAKTKLAVGSYITVNYDPFEKHSTRGAVIEGKTPNGYLVRFTSTKGESCDGGNRKPYQRADGKNMTTTSVVHSITYSQIL